MRQHLLLDAKTPLRGADAVAALLVLDDGRYVMQLRDNKPDIFYPDHWGCFGGAVDGGEQPLDAIARELKEELEYELEAPPQFHTRFDFDLSRLGGSRLFRMYYEIRVSGAAFAKFVLHEGAAFEAVTAHELLLNRRVTPYDSFALWLHFSKVRMSGERPQ